MTVPIITKTAYTNKGNKYTKSRVGKIAGAVGFGIAGNISANKIINAPQFTESVKASMQVFENMAKSMGAAFEPAGIEQAVKNFGKQTKTVTIATMAVVGLVLGAVADFGINCISKIVANKKAGQNK